MCACPRLSSSRCRQTNVESSSLYFWSIWEQHVFFLIIVHSRMKIYEVLKHASMHLPVVVHYWPGTTTNYASLVLKRVRMRSYSLQWKTVIDLFPAVFIFYSSGNTSLSRKGMQRRAAVSFQWKTAFKRSEEDVQQDFAVKFSVENGFILPYLMAQHEY